MQTHNSFFALEPSLANLQSVCKARLKALVLRRISGGCCPVLHSFSGHAATSPGRFSAPKREFQEQSKRAPRATGVFLKMASRSCVSGCGRFLASSDGHDRCPSCLGFQHAEAALVDESCSHCGNMTMAMLRSRYLLARRGGIPLALPHSSSSGRRTTSAQGQGDLRITVRASPSSMSPRAFHSSSTSHRLGRCQAGLFGKAVEDFAAQKQTEAFHHILPRRSAAVSTPPPAAAPPSARRRGRPPAASTSAPARPQQQPSLRPQRGAGRRRPAQPASAPAKPVKRQSRRRP